jgi:broad specificity phosphatase PhoE
MDSASQVSTLSSQPLREAWWVRHGESVGNAGERTSDPGSYSLTARGFAQADAFAAHLARRPDLIVVSPYVRARATAAPTIARFPGVPVEEWPIQEITFLAPARCIDTTQVERRLMAREYWAKFDPDSTDGPGAESFGQTAGRARLALERLRTRHEPFILIFSHAVFMRIMHWLALTQRPVIDGEAMRLCYEFIRGWDVPNCGVLPMLAAPDGTLYTGPVCDPTGTAGEPANAEQIQLSGL